MQHELLLIMIRGVSTAFLSLCQLQLHFIAVKSMVPQAIT